jgi:hypothetical protein
VAIIGNLDRYSRADWPMPIFSRVDRISGEETLIRYSEDEPIDEVADFKRSKGDNQRYPVDGLWGYAAVEDELTELLA